MESLFFAWATEHYFLGFWLLYVLLKGSVSIVQRFLRMLMIMTRGWPKHQLMDADGDFPFPSKLKEMVINLNEATELLKDK